ncbi:MAG TPA: amidase family protein, partial [Clostridia bacterium]
GMDPKLKEQVLKTIDVMSKLGMEMVEISIPHSVYALPVYYIITPSEISANMSRYDGIRFGNTSLEARDVLDLYLKSREIFEDEVKRRIFIGNYALSSGYYDAYYNKAMQVRTLILKEMEETFKKVDVIVGPTTPTPSFKIGENTADPVAMYLADIFTVTSNIAGIPSISIPCGLADGLPVGFQIMGKQFDEKSVLDAAYAVEKEIRFADNYSPDMKKL